MGRKTVTVSEEVWGHVAEHGRFGESFDDVLRRMLGLREAPAASGSRRPSQNRRAERRLSPYMVDDGCVVLGWDGGEELRLRLPARDDRSAITQLAAEAKRWARDGGASDGQLKAIDKLLSEAGYYRRGPRRRTGGS